MLHQGCSLFNRSRGVRDQKLQCKCFWTQSHSGTCTHIPFATCFVAVRPTLEWTCRNSREKNFCIIFYVHLRSQPWLECYIWNSSIPLINWKAVTADLKTCGGGIHLMQHWMGGHTATKAMSQSYEAFLITVLQRAFHLCLSVSFADICASPAPSHSLTQSQTTHSQSSLYNLWCCSTIAWCGVLKYGMIPLSGLFPNIYDLQHSCQLQWTKSRNIDRRNIYIYMHTHTLFISQG